MIPVKLSRPPGRLKLAKNTLRFIFSRLFKNKMLHHRPFYIGVRVWWEVNQGIGFFHSCALDFPLTRQHTYHPSTSYIVIKPPHSPHYWWMGSSWRKTAFNQLFLITILRIDFDFWFSNIHFFERQVVITHCVFLWQVFLFHAIVRLSETNIAPPPWLLVPSHPEMQKFRTSRIVVLKFFQEIQKQNLVPTSPSPLWVSPRGVPWAL